MPILKIDGGLAPESDGVQVMEPFTKLDGLLKLAKENNVFGTKALSLIKVANKPGIKVRGHYDKFPRMVSLVESFFKTNVRLICIQKYQAVVEQQFEI